MKETRIVKYELETPGFENVEFTESSKEFLTWPKAVKFAADQNAVLQSLREAAAFRIEAQGKDDADRYQATRTCAVYFKDGNKFYVAFDDIPDTKENIVLARAIDGYEANKAGREFLLSKKDKHIAQFLKRAEKSDRIVQVVESPLELATKTNAGSSEFGSNKAVQALFGDIAELYAAILKSRDYDEGFVYVLTPESLDKHVAGDKALVRPVGLGDDNYNCIYVDANNRFYYFGRARGVRRAREFSTGNKALVGTKK
jgi:hypothetical protein